MKCAIYICKGSQRSGGSRTKSKHRRLLHRSSDCLLAVCITCRFYNNKNQGNWIFKQHLRDYATTKKSFLPKWGKLFLTLYWSEDWYWLELSCLILFGFQPYSSSVMKRKGRFCQPGLPMKFYICRWLGHLPVFFFLSVLDGRALKKNTLHYQIWITKFQFDWRSILNTPQVISKSRPQHIIGRNGSGSCSAVRCLPLDGCVTIDNSESGKVCDPDQEPSAGNSFLNRTQN